MSKLIMFIGIPGSGKTTAARKYRDDYIAKHGEDILIIEADTFFTDPLTGKYKWDRKKLGQAHTHCQIAARIEMINGRDVIVSNTSLTPKEREPYLKSAKKYGYDVEVITCNGEYKNVHGVPEETIERMKKKFIPYSENELEKI